MTKRSRRSGAVVSGCLVWAACAAPLATPEQTEQVTQRMLRPFLQQRTVVCNELEIDMSAIFDRCVTVPGSDEHMHRFEVADKDGVREKVWTNVSGTEAGWFTIRIGAEPAPEDVSGVRTPCTTYKVLNRVVRRVRGGEVGLSVRASGPIVMVEEAGGRPRDVQEFAIVDGVLQR